MDCSEDKELLGLLQPKGCDQFCQSNPGYEYRLGEEITESRPVEKVLGVLKYKKARHEPAMFSGSQEG